MPGSKEGAIAEIARFTVRQPSHTRRRANDVNRLSTPVSMIVIEPVPCCDRMKAHDSPMSVRGSRKVLLHLVDV